MTHLALMFLASLLSTANAAEKTQNVVPSVTEMIGVQKAVDLFNALTYITGDHEKVVGEKTVRVPYDLGATPDKAADVRWSLADDISALRKFVTNSQEAQRKLIEIAEDKAGQHPLQPKKPAVLDAKGNVIEPAVPSEAQIELNVQLQKLLESERPVDKLFHITRADLKAGINQFPGPILSALEPILDK